MEPPVIGLLLAVDAFGAWTAYSHIIHVWWGLGFIGWIAINSIGWIAWRMYRRAPETMNLDGILGILGYPASLTWGIASDHFLNAHIVIGVMGIWLGLSFVVGSVAAFTHPHESTAPYILGWAALPLAMIGRNLATIRQHHPTR